MSTFVTRDEYDNKTSLLEYARKNRDEGFFNDITIIAGNENISANRLVLSCYSSYLEGMFKFFEREFNNDKLIEFKAVDGIALKALIDFIHTGSITINEHNVTSLLSGAHYLQLNEVKQFCFEFLQSHVSVDNSLNFLKIANVYKNKNMIKDKTKETTIFEAIIAWCNHDQEVRKTDFTQLFGKVYLKEVPIVYLKEVILEQSMVVNVTECYKAVLSAFHKQALEQNVTTQASKIIRLGGYGASPQVRVVLNLSTETSTTYPDLPVNNIYDHCSIIQDDYIYCIGGGVAQDKETIVLSNVWKLNLKNPSTGWNEVASLNEKRYVIGAAVHDDVIVVAGGVNENYVPLSSVEVYQTFFNEWRTISSMNQKRVGHALVSCGRYLYAFGGCVAKRPSSSCERLDSLNGKWKNIESMQTPKMWFSAVN